MKNSPIACQCGKWRGLKFKDVVCEKCHTEVKFRKGVLK